MEKFISENINVLIDLKPNVKITAMSIALIGWDKQTSF